MDDIYKNIEKYNLDKKEKILIMFDDLFADIFSNEKHNPTVNELLTTFLVFLLDNPILMYRKILS